MATKGKGASAVLTTTATAYVTAGANEVAILSRVTVYNSDSAARSVTWHRVPSGGSATSSNVLGVLTVGATSTENLPLPGAIFDNGDALYVKADAGSVVNFDASYTVADQLA